jgi:hypothetical protein
MWIVSQLDKKKRYLILCLVLIGASTLLAHAIQNDFGTIDVDYVRIIDENGFAITGKLHRPLTATESDPGARSKRHSDIGY